MQAEDTLLTVPVQNPVRLRWATFHYSNDTLSSNKDRVWKKVQGEIGEGKIVFPKPDEPFVYGFTFVMDHRGLAASGEMIIYRQIADPKR